MYAPQSKKLLIVCILEILKKYSDENHRLSQKEIGELLKQEYQITPDRKSIRGNLTILMEFGFDLEYSESVRTNSQGKEETLLTDWYLARDFTDSELRLLIDSLLFSKHIPYSQCRALVKKLEGLSSRYFQARVGHIATLPVDAPDNNQLFYTIDVLDEAISKGRQVQFEYWLYGPDKKTHPRLNHEGTPRQYRVSLYQMAASNGRYYLICNMAPYDNLSYYRVERIRNIQILDTPAKDRALVQGMEHGFDLSRHMAEHVYMYSGPSVRVTFRTPKPLISQLMEWFSGEIEFSNEMEKTVDAKVTVNREAMLHWAFQYAQEGVRVLKPLDLREGVATALREAAQGYK